MNPIKMRALIVTAEVSALDTEPEVFCLCLPMSRLLGALSAIGANFKRENGSMALLLYKLCGMVYKGHREMSLLVAPLFPSKLP